MFRDEEINQLANRLSTEVLPEMNREFLFTELYRMVEGRLPNMVQRYLTRKNLQGFSFYTADYISAIGQAMVESVPTYDINKGDFMGRLTAFAFRRMGNITEYNLADKRFDKSKQAISFEHLFESEQCDFEDTSCTTDTEVLISEFIKTDKEGMIIDILRTITDLKVRNSAFTQYFGEYGATQRKRVQRAKERLSIHLQNNGVLI